MVERMNGLTKEATTKAHRYETPDQVIADLAGWFVRYNFCRKHRRNGNKTPYQAALDWYQKDPTLFLREPTTLLSYRNGCSQSSETRQIEPSDSAFRSSDKHFVHFQLTLPFREGRRGATGWVPMPPVVGKPSVRTARRKIV